MVLKMLPLSLEYFNTMPTLNGLENSDDYAASFRFFPDNYVTPGKSRKTGYSNSCIRRNVLRILSIATKVCRVENQNVPIICSFFTIDTCNFMKQVEVDTSVKAIILQTVFELCPKHNVILLIRLQCHKCP
mmetsp:Transcript_11864/g.17120  ORF Transcript_11864/g.17120 Transcript_11864/m.17120 type:complete len:131 (-) Transcript_11864:1121-1513(-)